MKTYAHYFFNLFAHSWAMSVKLRYSCLIVHSIAEVLDR
jgi:hypothetical protein